MYGNDDSDMKIVGNFQPAAPAQDESEAAALLFERERSSGNLKVAHELGRFFAGELFAPDGIAYYDEAAADFERRNICILYTFVADQAMNACCPNAVIAQSAENEFYDEIRRRNLTLYESISRSGAFSIYLLCRKGKDGRRDGVGKAYARIIRRPDDPEAEKTGEENYKKFCDFCFEHLAKTKFSL
mgnify:CR=1 FL=1